MTSSSFSRSLRLGLFTVLVAASAVPAAAAHPALKILQKGVAPERQATIIKLVATSGDAEDLTYLFDEATKGKGFSPKTRLLVLDLLAQAARERQLKPAGDLGALTTLMDQAAREKSTDLLLATIRLGGTWKVAAIEGKLRQLAADDKTPDAVRRAAMEGLVTFGGKEDRAVLEKIAAGSGPMSIRLSAAAGLVSFDAAAAAPISAKLLAGLAPTDDPLPVLQAYVRVKGGTEKLAAAIAAAKLPTDAAKLCLRQMFAAGINDTNLSPVLSRAAGLDAQTALPTPAEIAALVKEVTTKGDAARGEKVFRRGDVGCFRCHSLQRAGGQVGPELTPIGGVSPVDYVVTSVLNPSQAIKEQYLTKTIFTDAGRQYTGIVTDRNENQVTLRDATGKLSVIPVKTIEEEIEGKSLMPEGITKFLTHDEVVDLLRFVSELGKPGPYAVRNVPAIQRWLVLREPAADLVGVDPPNLEHIREHVLDTTPDAWTSTYSMVSGKLPLGELKKNGQPRVILQGEVEVTEEGMAEVLVDCTEPFQVWIDAEAFEGQKQIATNLAAGRHKITVRVELGDRPDPTLLVELKKPEGSTIQMDAVGGQ